MTICDTPLVWSDLKVREREHRLPMSPYADESIFLKRYGHQAPRLGTSEAQIIKANAQQEDALAFLGRFQVRQRPRGLSLVRSLQQKWLLWRARKAARALDWSTAEHYYTKLIDANGANHHIWEQLGHALKEQGYIEPARYSYKMAVSLHPDDVEAHQHVSALHAQ
jgi:tetratricopeptide (TPR) repeat protein